MAEIPVSGRVVTWARKYRGLSLQEAAERLGMSEADLEKIETEVAKPTLTTFERMATTYRLPLSTLFRRTPPETPKDLPDFRTIEGQPPQKSFEFQVALDAVRDLQSVLNVLQSEDENFFAPALREYHFARDSFQQGESERAQIGISIERQIRWKAADGFRHWRAIIERQGISVYLQKFDLQDCRGCCIWDEGRTPAILINKADESEKARTFTLIHEYAHLLIRRPGISDLNNRNPVEAFCNRFAAAFLMPIAALRRVLPVWPEEAYGWDDDDITEGARALKVSAQAFALRLEELGRASAGLNRRFIFKPNRRRPPKGGGYVRTRLSEIGGRYTGSVVGALDRGVIDIVHAVEVLALTPPHFDRAREYVQRQRELASA